MSSVLITETNAALETLPRSWVTAKYSEMDGTGAMGSLHEFGDALVAVTRMGDEGPIVLGSGVMVGPGLLLTATHVLDEFPTSGAPPVFLAFLPYTARAWLPLDWSTLSGPSAFSEDRRQYSDVTLLSCTLNSDARVDSPLMLAPMQVALPLIGERLWAFGYRHGAIEAGTALITPLVASGLVTGAFPHGRGERMPASCLEMAMELVGGMSGGPVVNADGNLVGIATSSFDGGPSYVTLIWDALRLKVKNPLPSLVRRGAISLFAAQSLGLVRLKGNVRRLMRGDVVFSLNEAEARLMAASIDPLVLAESRAVSGTPLDENALSSFEDQWSQEMEREAADAAIKFLEGLKLSSVRKFLGSSNIPDVCLLSIRRFRVEDFEGIEDIEIHSAREQGSTIGLSIAFDLRTVIWTVEVENADYRANAEAFDRHFFNLECDSQDTRMDVAQRCYFEATLTFDQRDCEFTAAKIGCAGIMRSSKES